MASTARLLFRGEIKMIEFKDLGKVYPNGTEALKHATLDTEQGEFVAIMGLSGAGKSTCYVQSTKCIQLHREDD